MFSEDHKLQKNCLPVKMFCISVVWRILGWRLKFMKEDPNMKMLIDNGWRQSNVISSFAHLGAGMVITIC
jgi:hypothetical protein